MERLKVIEYRGGVLRFRVPADWVEEYEPEGGGTFYADRADSGTLRLNVLTFEGTALPTTDDLVRALEKKPTTPEMLPSGTALVAYQGTAEEAGEPLTIFRWELASAVGTRHLRMALFSYTVLERLASQPEVLGDVALLDREIRSAESSPQLGVTATVR